ncbi:MAG: penicillin-binding protein 1C [Synergistaceae bacterium]|nr:penicillin-binding protein 1C [Synergistaceae bacterium]
MRKFLLSLFALGVIIFAGLWLNIDINPEKVTTISGSPALYDSEGRLFHVRLSPDSEWQIPIPLEDMGHWLPLVAVNAEDGRFYSHFGIDLLAMSRALWQDLTQGRVVSGASTITTQVIRMAVSEREGRKRTPSTKVREFIMALKLEHELTKAQILETYLNLAPFGGNIRGVQAASLMYFGKKASQISPGEACLMIGMLKGPSIYRPDTRPSASRRRRNEIIALMERKGVFTHEEAERAYLEDLPAQKSARGAKFWYLPSRAWHFSELVLTQNPDHSQKFETTLNLETQTKLEGILRQSLNDFPADITISAGIADNKTASLIAWVGNARFSYGTDPSSWVDCGRAPRSPGSTLKPFAYLAAIDSGTLTPSTLLADTSMAFSGRAPRNFDLKYRGAVTARVALSESLNAPAVRVLRSAGNDKVLSLMREAGLRHLTQNAKYYGDSLILGGCDITLLEELEAFTAIASLGVHRNLKLLKDSAQISERIATEGGCWLVSDMLRYNGELSRFASGTLGGKWRVSLKTGTSYGLRDAWAAAWTPDYTVVVWAGNPDGDSWPGLVGARAAAPVAVKILRMVSPKSGWYEKPEGVVLREVCALSGKPPTAMCPAVKTDWAVEGVTKTFPCDIHALRSGQRVVNLPAEFSANLNRKNELAVVRKYSELKIISPVPGASYFAAPFDLERKIPMKTEGATGRVWWYIDGEYAGSSEADRTFFHDVPDGKHVVSVVDEAGRSAKVDVQIFTPGRKNRGDLLF